MEQGEERGRGGNEQSVWIQKKFTEGDQGSYWEGQTGRALHARLRALDLKGSKVMGCHKGTCLVGGLQASSADKALGTKESDPKSLLFISINGVLFHLLTAKTGRIIMLWLL